MEGGRREEGEYLGLRGLNMHQKREYHRLIYKGGSCHTLIPPSPSTPMDYVFLLDEGGRAAFFHRFGKSLGCTYICLWSFFPSQPSNNLICKDGWWNESTNITDQPSSRTSSSSSPIAHSLFHVYRASIFNIASGGVPGLVSKEVLPYLELEDAQLLSLATNVEQQQFYKEAGIKTVCFLGSKAGEIEFGKSTSRNTSWQMDIMEFVEELMQQKQAAQIGQEQQQLSIPSSSSSSFISPSMGSPEYSSLFFNMPTTTYTTPDTAHAQLVGAPPIKNTLQTKPPYSSSFPPQIIQPSLQMPSAASDIDAAMTRAILAVISSQPNITTPFYNQLHAQQQAAQADTHVGRQGGRAFKRYAPAMGVEGGRRRGPSLTKRAVAFLRRIPREIVEAERPLQQVRPTHQQLHHMMGERKRREKLNELFQALRRLLPVGTKKQKASVLSTAIETLEALRNDVTELNKKIKQQDQGLSQPNTSRELASQVMSSIDAINNEGVHVKISEGSGALSSSERTLELQVAIGEDACNVTDMVNRLLECMKQMNNVVSVISIEARSQLRHSQSFSLASIRLVIKTDDWNEQTFKKEVTKAVDKKPGLTWLG